METRFAWLLEKALRRSALKEVETAIRSGRLDDAPDRVGELVAVLETLRLSSDLTEREEVRVRRVVAALEERGLCPAPPDYSGLLDRAHGDPGPF